MPRTLRRLRVLVVLVAVAGLSLTTLTTLVWATARAVRLIGLLVAGGWAQDASLIDLLEIIDLFLVVVVQLIVALGLYELFIADLDLPAWLTVHDLGELKRSVVDLLVVIIGIKYLERALASTAGDTLSYGIATALVIIALVTFTATDRGHRHQHSTPRDS
ncbi:YqhA family protein [Pseudonocardia sp. ICBG1034]|uniref:YqhA family protein n=1 Tax=Pseudonocardia sp. ICBG1034 TaxID=2844381 RepID=UPI001CCA685A|nr:YqhA family protein [Pseudonocardia sp. ICBG1034]